MCNRGPFLFPRTSWSTHQSLCRTGVLCHCHSTNHRRSLDGYFPPPQTANHSCKEATQGISPLSWWVVGCAEGWGIASQVPFATGVMTTIKDSTSAWWLVSGPSCSEGMDTHGTCSAAIVLVSSGIPVQIAHVYLKFNRPAFVNQTLFRRVVLVSMVAYTITSKHGSIPFAIGIFQPSF